MAKKGEKLSEETRKKISDSLKNPSKETRKKISEAGKGRRHSEASKRKISESNKGKNKGKTPSVETRLKIGKSNTGKKHTENWKKQMSESKKGKKNPMYGKTSPNKDKKTPMIIRRKISEARSKQKLPFRDSKPELITQNILKKNQIKFLKHTNFRLAKSNHQADIVIEPNKVIEVFGDYWHFNPKMYDGESIHKRNRGNIKVKEKWEYDKNVINGMKKQGYKVLVVWESELKNELNKISRKILKFAKS